MPELHIVTKQKGVSVRAALKEGISRLRAANVPSDALAAELLLMHTLGRDRTWLYSHPDAPIDAAAIENYLALVDRRAAGEPTQYLTGKQEFWGLEFEVNPSVLIPRPETEHVVEVALERLKRPAKDQERGADLAASGRNAPLRIADVGTGSGCIAVALAHELPRTTIVATDISEAALAVARRNATRHDVADRIQFIQCDLLEGLAVRPPLATRQSSLPFNLIVGNPPYISRDEADSLQREVRDHEPHAALFGGTAGTEIYGRLIDQSAAAFVPGGILVLELGHTSAPRVQALLTESPVWTAVEITNDLAGIPRVISAQKA